ncbi:MAG: phage DNA ejection protein [Plesiomonas shigelloides]
MIAPIDYTSQAANMFNQGVSSGLGMQRASMLRQEQEAQAAAKEKQQVFNKSLQTAWESGDNKQMIDLIAANPEQMQTIQGMLGIRDQQQKTNIANVAQQLNAAITSGNMQGAAGVINSNADFLSSIGQDPRELLGDLQSDPQSLLRGAESMMLMTMSPEDVMKYKQKLEDQAITRRGQDITLRGQNISAQNAAFDREIKRAELQDKAIDRQLSRETNELKIEELKIKQQEVRDKIEKAKAEKEDAYLGAVDTMDRTIETANKVLNSEGFSGYFGTNINPLSSRFIPGTAAADTSALIDTLKSQGFMSGIQQMKGMGNLSNAEGQKVVDAIGSLSANQSEKSAKEAIKTIIDTTEQAKKRMAKKSGKEYTPWTPPEKAAQQQPQATSRDQVGNQSGYSSLWGG